MGIPGLFDVVLQLILPTVAGLTNIPITAPSLIFFTLATLIALRKYDFLSYDPIFAREEVLEMMDGLVVIFDHNFIVKYTNSGFLKLIGFTKKGTSGWSINDFDSSENPDLKFDPR